MKCGMPSALVYVYENSYKQKYVNYRLRACGRVISDVSKDRDASVFRISHFKPVDEDNCQHGCRAVLYTVPQCHHKTPTEWPVVDLSSTAAGLLRNI